MKKYHNSEKIKRYIGIKLREARIQAGYSQQALGKELGLTHGAIGSYERGRLSMTIQLLLQYCEILKKPLSFFIGPEYEEELAKIDRQLQEARAEAFKKYNLDENVEFSMEMSIRNYLKSKGIKDPDVFNEIVDRVMDYILDLTQ